MKNLKFFSPHDFDMGNTGYTDQYNHNYTLKTQRKHAMSLKRNKYIVVAIGLLFQMSLKVEAMPIDTTLAKQYFQEFQLSCNQDNGKLWGVSFYGPMLIADPETHSVVANQGDMNGNLKQSGDVYVGTLPKTQGIADTATFWSGKKWLMLRWPLNEDKYERARLMIHESFHRIQEEIGFPLFNSASDHLDTYEGRIWLQLEWRALIKALSNKGDERRKAIKDALVFRIHRRNQFSDTDSLENRLEMNEGLAEYTGIKLCGIPDYELTSYVVKKFDQAKEWETFIRSFPYLSGPAYGVLLDEAGVAWRKNLKATDDLGKLLQNAHLIEIPNSIKSEAEARAFEYDFETLQEIEIERKQKLQKLMAEYQERFITGPVLIIPISQKGQGFSITFKPTNLFPLGTLGTVYATMKIATSWGELTVTDGAVLTPDWNKVYVPAPVNPNVKHLTGKGWELSLDENWKLVSAEREGDFTLEKVEK
ncbi:hypothetical protein ACFL6P_07385 [Candidatus Latescibacterota bacterium]